MATVYLSLGSNLDDRLRFLKEAIKKIRESDQISLKQISSVYESEPVGYENQPWFLNVAVEVRTSLDPFPLLELLLTIEAKMGRKREKRWGPRKIDLDILLFDALILDSDRLTLPHPRMHQRKFVLIPLAQIAPRLMHPLLGKNMEELLKECRDKSKVKLYQEKI